MILPVASVTFNVTVIVLSSPTCASPPTSRFNLIVFLTTLNTVELVTEA